MNIFANLKDHRNIKRKREIILLFKENFCDFQLIREHLNEYNFDKEEVVFILNTGLLNERQEANLSSFLNNELGTRFIKEDYKAPERYLCQGQPSVRVYHRHLECTIFTSDPTEKDVEELQKNVKKIVGYSNIIRRSTEEEIINKHQQKRKSQIIDSIKGVGNIILFFAIAILIILSCIYVSEHKDVISIIGWIIAIGVILFVFAIVWSFISDSTENKFYAVIKSILITVLLFGLLILLGYLMPDSCSGYINDSHRPDHF